ncbi:dTDP-4-dehydrorhamnose 3,5-epimerase [Asticcacaulis endophyticus]|uniref:dTDP-4-dehydrorhamnose 3,5-epimerase n=1 Tax=Asticcacaulis endophyticus TaxID=1395890 RepID=A0A918UPS9_9CAUL|nr:dTDP-4-dehydrorhamnose 3,5-epimerase [Asticcacaulis endophyticus]GGZ25746.1 dTDP-4-dehydrorhamnose 3,5-epimerase [Asticcacaulis endophyticus]
MHVRHFDIKGPALILPKRHEDARGYFYEAFRDDAFRQTVADVTFVQDNQALSKDRATLRGLHYQRSPAAQGKLVRCLKGSIFDVAVDIRKGSDTFGRWLGQTLTASGGEQLWVPEGFAHGYVTLEDDTEVFYKVTHPYSPEHEAGIAFDDPDISVAWPFDPALVILSAKDKAQPRLAEMI